MLLITLLQDSVAGSEALLQKSVFTPSSNAAPATMFTKLEPATTGLVVQNDYDDPAMWSSRYRAFMGGAMGSGIAAGDFDGDGKVDLYVSTKTKPGRLFKNLGNWKFADITEAAGLSENNSVLSWMKGAISAGKTVIWRQGAVFADINNDGFLDLFVCRNNAPNLLYVNQGNGTFKEEAEERGLATVDGSVVGAFADYDRDGWLDLFLLTNQVDGTEPSGRPDRLFHNNGKGYFTEVTQRSGFVGATFGHAATWFDYDGDGWPDLYVCNDFSGPDRLYRNNKDGTFTDVIDSVAPHTSYSSMGADVADVNNDGYSDLLVADMATTTREKDQRGLAASKGDVLMTGTREGTAPQYMRNTLLLNTGRSVFREAGCWAGVDATGWTWSVRFEDFDNDGRQDLHVTNGMVREANNSDVLQRMMGALSDPERINVMKKSPVLEEPNLAYRNLQGTGFEPVTDQWGLGEVGVSFGAVTADLDNDGDLDLVYLNYNGGVSVFRNDISARHRVQVRLHGTRSNRQGVGAIVRIESDVTGRQMRTMTVSRGYASGSEIVAHFGLGADNKISRLVVEWPSGIEQVFSNLNADRAYVITEPGTGAQKTSESSHPLYRDQSEKSGLKLKDESPLAIPDKEQAFIPFRTDRRGPSMVVTDVDGDGHDDIFLGSTTGSPARLLRWKNGTYVTEALPGIPRTNTEDGPALSLDFDGNGTKDLLITKTSANASAWPDSFKPIIYSNDGYGGFAATDCLPDLPLNAGAACAADFDLDGHVDLFLGGRSVPGRYPEAPQSVLLRNVSGHFVDVTADSPALNHIGLVKSALFRDVDGDGAPDLIIALEWDFVRYFHNDRKGRFSDWTEKTGFMSGGRGWWNSLASADLNGDGRSDFIAGNLGLNTPYKATAKHPVTLFYGDFAQNGTKLLAEAVYDGDVLYPLRARVDLGSRLPSILRKFPRNDDFARATFANVFGEKALSAAEIHRAENFSSGVFVSQPDGSYRFEAFPRVAQIGPILGIVACDLDGDGFIDVCATQNTDIATPRFDGGVGLFLKGKGNGTFEASEPAQSGIVIPGNGRSLVIVDPSEAARPDLFLTRHGATTVYLANQSTTARWLKLRLQGTKENSDAIGAKVHLAFSNRTPSYYEIGCGGGWLSQSASCIYVAVPADGSLTETIVTWPDGHVSHHIDAPDHGAWVIKQPAGS